MSNETQPASEQVNQETGLAPCPFCGRIGYCGRTDQPNWWYAWCNFCHVRLFGESKEQVIERWNKRAPLTATTSPWIRTADRAPTKEDADVNGKVLATFGLVTVTADWDFVEKYRYHFWIPIPALPTKEE